MDRLKETYKAEGFIVRQFLPHPFEPIGCGLNFLELQKLINFIQTFIICFILKEFKKSRLDIKLIIPP